MSIADHYTDETERMYIRLRPSQPPYFAPGQLHLIENFNKALADNFQGWHLHHRLELNPDGTLNKTRECLIIENLYYYRPADELAFMPIAKHSQVHIKALVAARGTIYKASAETKAKQSEAKLKANNTEARYAVVSAMVERGETLSYTDYAFYRRYCKRNGIPFVGAKVDKSHTLTRVDVPLVKSEKQLKKDDMPKTQKRYRDVIRRLSMGEMLPIKELSFLRRYCTKRNLELPKVSVTKYGVCVKR